MTVFIGLLRAVNVGGTGKLPMAELRAVCDRAGFARARTYIASGNVVFETRLSEKNAKAALERGLAAHAGRPVGVVLRTAAEMAELLAGNPFAGEAPNRVVAIFLDRAPPADALDKVSGQRNERTALGKRELYVHYADGIADSKLKISAATQGTARNMNTVAKLVELASKPAV